MAPTVDNLRTLFLKPAAEMLMFLQTVAGSILAWESIPRATMKPYTVDWRRRGDPPTSQDLSVTWATS